MTKTERQICDAFFELMKEKSCSAIKVAELTRIAGISRSTFYVYFDSIDDVLQTVEDDFLSNLVDEKEVRADYDVSVIAKNFSFIRDNLEKFELLTLFSFHQRQHFGGELFKQHTHLIDAYLIFVIGIPAIKVELAAAHIFADQLFLRIGEL